LRSLTDPKPEAAKEEPVEEKKAEDKNDAAHVLADLYGADVKDNGYTRDSDLSQLLGHKGVAAPRVQVIRGDKSENLDFYQDKQ
jgi:hypothetical protein